MMKWMLAAGAAALAIASPVSAEKGGHGGKGQGNQQASAEPGGGGGGQKQAHSKHGGSSDRQVRTNGGGGDRQARQRGGGSREVRADHVKQAATRARPARCVSSRTAIADAVAAGTGSRASMTIVGVGMTGVRSFRWTIEAGDVRCKSARQPLRRPERRQGISCARCRSRVVSSDVDRDELFARRLGYGRRLPAGPAKKGNGCMPPGQAAVHRPAADWATRFGG